MVDRIGPDDDASTTLVHDIRTKLFAAEPLVKLKQMHLPSLDFERAK